MIDAAILDPTIAVHVVTLWQAPLIKSSVEQREDPLQLPSSINYFFDNAKKYAVPSICFHSYFQVRCTRLYADR